MSADYLGSFTLGGAMPQATSLRVALDASIGVVLPELQAKLTGLLALQARIAVSPPDLTAKLNAALAAVAALQAAISVGLPTASLQVTVIADLVARIQADIGDLNVNLSLSADIAALLGAAGVHAYKYTGAASGLGPQLSSTIGTTLPGGQSTDQVGAVLLASSVPNTIAALATWYGVSL